MDNANFDLKTWTFNTEQVRVNATLPSNQAITVSTGSNVEVFFQQPVNKETVAGNIKLRKAFGIQEEFFFKGEPSYEVGDTKVIFRTKVAQGDQGLENNTRYEISVKGVRSVEGEAFQDFRSFFTTE